MKNPTPTPAPALHDVLQGMIAWRKTERDLERIAADPGSLPGFDRLPAGVQALAEADPMSFWMLWQLSQEGVDLHAIDTLGERLDNALRGAGWDGESPPSDAQFDAAEAALTRWPQAQPELQSMAQPEQQSMAQPEQQPVAQPQQQPVAQPQQRDG